MNSRTLSQITGLYLMLGAPAALACPNFSGSYLSDAGEPNDAPVVWTQVGCKTLARSDQQPAGSMMMLDGRPRVSYPGSEDHPPDNTVKQTEIWRWQGREIVGQLTEEFLADHTTRSVHWRLTQDADGNLEENVSVDGLGTLPIIHYRRVSEAE